MFRKLKLKAIILNKNLSHVNKFHSLHLIPFLILFLFCFIIVFVHTKNLKSLQEVGAIIGCCPHNFGPDAIFSMDVIECGGQNIKGVGTS